MFLVCWTSSNTPALWHRYIASSFDYIWVAWHACCMHSWTWRGRHWSHQVSVQPGEHECCTHSMVVHSAGWGENHPVQIYPRIKTLCYEILNSSWLYVVCRVHINSHWQLWIHLNNLLLPLCTFSPFLEPGSHRLAPWHMYSRPIPSGTATL